MQSQINSSRISSQDNPSLPKRISINFMETRYFNYTSCYQSDNTDSFWSDFLPNSIKNYTNFQKTFSKQSQSSFEKSSLVELLNSISKYFSSGRLSIEGTYLVKYKQSSSSRSGERPLVLFKLTVTLEPRESAVEVLCLSKFVTVLLGGKFYPISFYKMLNSLLAILE